MASFCGAGMFPLPLLEVPRSSNSRSARNLGRARRLRLNVQLAIDAVGALNRLHVSHSQSIQNRNPSSLSLIQSRAHKHIQMYAGRYLSCLASGEFRVLSGGVWVSKKFYSQDTSDLNAMAYSNFNTS